MSAKYLNLIRKIIDDIEDDISRDINVLKLAEDVSLSPWHFQRIFKSIVGDSLGGYIRGRRLSLAAEKLMASEHSVIDIAFDVGFNSHEAFTRSFKAFFNFTPKHFRLERPKVLKKEKAIANAGFIKASRAGDLPYTRNVLYA